MMLRITQCAAPLASLFLFAAAFAFVGNAAQAAGGFAGNVVEAGAAPTATESKHLTLESSRLCRAALPRGNARPRRPPFTADARQSASPAIHPTTFAVVVRSRVASMHTGPEFCRDFAVVHRPGTGRAGLRVEECLLSQDRPRANHSHPTHRVSRQTALWQMPLRDSER